jgi:membrane protease YdiL (CAAX protease family)
MNNDQKSKNIALSNFNWRLFGLLLGLVALGLLALIPYGLTLVGETFSISLVPQFFVQILLYSGLIIAGLLLGRKVGLGAPILEKIAAGNKPAGYKKPLRNAVLIGLGAGLLMILADVYLFAPYVEVQLQALGEIVQPPAWQGLLASFYGGIVEEVMMRLFLLTLLAWLGSLIIRPKDGNPSPVVMWISILISGLVFGLAHLPTLTQLGITVTPIFIIRTFVLNAVGLYYGWLYWKKGLAFSMAGHFATDIMVHVLGALLLS